MLKTSVWKLVCASKERLIMVFASAGDYYQSIHENKLLRQAIANLHTNAFEQWHLERNDDAQLSGLANDLHNICDILCIL